MIAIRADLIVGADGRHSTVREKAGFKSEDYGAPMDVLWFRVSRKQTDSTDTFGHIEAGRMMVMLDRGDYWQCAFVIPKGGIEQVKAKGLDAFRDSVVDMSPFLTDRIGELKSWNDIKLLSVTRRSPAEVVAAGSDLHRRFRARHVANRRRRHQCRRAGRGRGRQSARRAAEGWKRSPDADLQAIQERRTLPVRFTQWLQLTIQKRIITRVLGKSAAAKAATVL